MELTRLYIYEKKLKKLLTYIVYSKIISIFVLLINQTYKNKKTQWQN